MSDRPFYLYDADYLASLGIPLHHQMQVMNAELMAKFGAIVEQMLAGNGGQPIRVPVARVQEILADNGFAVAQNVDGSDFLFSIADRAETQRLVDQYERKAALRRMGPGRN